MSTLVREAKYIKADFNKNNNKFWYIREFDDGVVETEWGRVGKTSQNKTKDFGDQYGASRFFDKKCSEKEKSGRNGEIAYRKLDVVGNSGSETTTSVVTGSNLKKVALKQITTDSKATDKLIEYLVKQNVHNILSATTMTYNSDTGLFSTPCGIITQNGLDEANDLLIDIADYVENEKYKSKKFSNLAGDYLMLIPQEVGHKLDLETIFPDLTAIQNQKAILDSLQASLDSMLADDGNDTDKKDKKAEKKVFEAKLELVKDAKKIDRIKKKYLKTLHNNHVCSHLRVKRVFSMEIGAMKNAFQKGKKVGNVHEYWHGTKVSNVLSILKGGLIIPPSNASNVTGRLFGNGLYFSSESTKSLNYSYGYWGGSRDENCFMFLADVAMGKSYIPTLGDSCRFPVKGYDSTWAKAGVSGTSGYRKVMNHEMITYNLNQCNLTYLVEFTN